MICSLLFLTALEIGKFIQIKIFNLCVGQVLSIHRILVKHWKLFLVFARITTRICAYHAPPAPETESHSPVCSLLSPVGAIQWRIVLYNTWQYCTLPCRKAKQIVVNNYVWWCSTVPACTVQYPDCLNVTKFTPA